MADFLPAFERMIRNEGGYVLHDVPGDRGGQTYAGIARKYHPHWRGWIDIDAGREPEAEAVREFYREHFWQPLQGDALRSQAIAQTLFDFAVNAGIKPAVILAQTVLGGLTPDGRLGPKTLAALNEADEALFAARYALAKIARYAEIVRRDRNQAKFLLGWINRVLREAA